MPKTTNLKKDDEKRIKALYEAGATQRELAKIYGVGLTKINDICKGADREQTQELINQGVNFNVALAHKSIEERQAITRAVDDRTRNILFFDNSILQNQLKADELLKNTNNLLEVETHSKITARNKEAVCGKIIHLANEQTSSDNQPFMINIVEDKTGNE
ncbi:hypothetical protein [Campylobacter rectus]|uniref:hypothetical protein n=1 Tax=Campylobacter rectus TaxID=203 RepID=UPI0023EFDCF6|nr:hypothetical protein [Campylobacter rectus]